MFELGERSGNFLIGLQGRVDRDRLIGNLACRRDDLGA